MSPLRALLDRDRGVALMGILNRTPDSFSDGGRFVDEAAAHARIDALVTEGAEVIDVGAESTRPGSQPVAAAEQLARIGDGIRRVVAAGAVASIDTTSPEVAAWALDEGASVVNSVSLEPAAELGAICARRGAALVLMHSRGSMSAMAGFSVYDDAAYDDVVADVAAEWSEAADRALSAGLPREELLFDPGLGFAKNARHSLSLCARLDELAALGYAVVVGASRKSFVARAAAVQTSAEIAPPGERLGGSLAVALACVERGARVVRTHDVAETAQALRVARAIADASRAAARRAPESPRAGGAPGHA